jgi:hypothetical protein
MTRRLSPALSHIGWTDVDGAQIVVTSDPDTCQDDDGVVYPLVISTPEDSGTGGVFVSYQQARLLRDFIDDALLGGTTTSSQESGA